MSIVFGPVRTPGRTSVRTALDVAIGAVVGIGLLAGLHVVGSLLGSFALMTLGVMVIGVLTGVAARWLIGQPGIGLGAGLVIVLVVATGPVSPLGWSVWDGYPSWLRVDLGAAVALAGVLFGLAAARPSGQPDRPEQPDPGS